ncbi:DUF1330 domain-containing protein [Shewanella glacialipiscicola]|uniref:DUF1330 domain-containing protein n=1 Tax=Shewanella glacialipiscicola TaxID=614069 RepID=UPI003D7B2717
MAAYLLIQATIKDMAAFKRYTAVVPQLVQKYGGQYAVMENNHVLLEGKHKPGSVVLSTWPDEAAAQKFWQSDEYAAAKQLRQGSGQFHVMLLHSLGA